MATLGIQVRVLRETGMLSRRQIDQFFPSEKGSTVNKNNLLPIELPSFRKALDVQNSKQEVVKIVSLVNEITDKIS